MIGSMVEPRLAQTFLLGGHSYAAIVVRPREGRSGDLCPSFTEAWLQLVGEGGGHKALLVSSVSLWRRLLASRP